MKTTHKLMLFLGLLMLAVNPLNAQNKDTTISFVNKKLTVSDTSKITAAKLKEVIARTVSFADSIKNRATHTGVQPQSSITGLGASLGAKADTVFVRSTYLAKTTIATAKIIDSLDKQKIIACWGNSLTAANPGYPSRLSVLTGRTVYNGGIGGETSTQIKVRMLAATDKYSYPTIIWAGRNNYTDTTTVKADIAAMVAALGHNNYLVMGILNGEYPAEYQGGSFYNLMTRLNTSLANIYGSHYVPIREYMVSKYDPAVSQDVIDHGRDIVPSSLRIDNIHLTVAGYNLVAQYIYDNYLTVLTGNGTYTTVPRLSDVYRLINNTNTVTKARVDAAYLTEDALINNVKIGKGKNSISTNTVLGASAGSNFSTGAGNTVLGYNAGRDITTGVDNTFVGMGAGTFTTGGYNTFIGKGAGSVHTTGNQNVFIGQSAGTSSISGSYNTIIGQNSGFRVNTGSYNTFVGFRAGYEVTTGGYNVYLGSFDGTGFATSTNNVFISDGAGNRRIHIPSTGNLLLPGTLTDNTSDRLQVDGNINLTVAGNKLKIATGTNASVGTATLAGGTVTVNTTAIGAGSLVFFSRKTAGGTVGNITYTQVNGTSITFTSDSGSDTSTINWWIINQ